MKGTPLSVLALLALAAHAGAQAPQPAPTPKAKNPPSKASPSAGLPSEMPATFKPVTGSFDHERRVVMIPMRDGVKLHTVILIPRGAKGAPILLTRTPYDADALTSHTPSSHLASVLDGYDNAVETIVEGGYIRAVQDVRGKHNSEGDYVMNRPLHGPLNPTAVDHATDTYDTIDWLVKNVPESNGRVGILGISYDGFLPLMALINPHPALKCSVPMNPMVDGWMGDDWFHNGAFRQIGASYIYEQEATRKNDEKWWNTHYDDYDTYLSAGSAGDIGKQHGMEQLGFWRRMYEHPAYDAWWQAQAMDKILAKEPLKVPVMLVHSLWDQEDIYGAPAVYKAIEPKDTGNDRVFLVLGPWHHGQEIHEGSTLGAIHFGSDTALTFRREILAPFLAKYLKDDASAQVSPVYAFETGTNQWRRLTAWPSGCASGCAIQAKPLYLGADGKAGFAGTREGDAAYTEYVSDPAKPVPFNGRPSLTKNWAPWLVSDQRGVSGRTDVAAFTSDVLTSPVKIAGQPVVNLTASTSGTDSDWVVKVIDVYPDEVAGQPEMGGYQLMVSADIFRGRYRESLETAKAIEAGKPLLYKWTLPTANHVFLPGHRIMVQVQSSWFPLYDRNPQTFVENIFWAKPSDYKKATQRVYAASFVELPVAASP
jgi:putative CocE/NonD family hydrolase